jgi:hypothetical protein
MEVEYNLHILEKSSFVKFNSSPSGKIRADPSGRNYMTNLIVV